MKYLWCFLLALKCSYGQILFWPYGIDSGYVDSGSMESVSFQYAVPVLQNVDTLLVQLSVESVLENSNVSFSLLGYSLGDNSTPVNVPGTYRIPIYLPSNQVSGELSMVLTGGEQVVLEKKTPVISFLSAEVDTILGERGSTWRVGSTVPGEALWGDFFLDTLNGDVYFFSDSWKLVSNLKGEQGENASLSSGSNSILENFKLHYENASHHNVKQLNEGLAQFQTHVQNKALHFTDSMAQIRTNQYADSDHDGLLRGEDFETFSLKPIQRWSMENSVLTSTYPASFSTSFSADTVFHTGVMHIGRFNNVNEAVTELLEANCIDGQVYSTSGTPNLSPTQTKRYSVEFRRYPFFDPIEGDTARSMLSGASPTPIKNALFWDDVSGGEFPGGAYEIVCVNQTWWVFR